MSESELQHACEFIKNRLYWVSLRTAPRQTSREHFFTTDNELVYWNFFLDFGPLNLGQVYRFAQKLNAKLSDKRLANKRIYFYSSTHSHKRTNAAFLISAYAMLFLGRSPEDAYHPFRGIYPPFPPFHDASPCVCTYNLTILDCLKGMHKARECKFFDFDMFDVEEYEHYEKVENGDLNWIAEGKFAAFAGPHDARTTTVDGYVTLVPEDYIPYYKKKGVSLVIRLNKKYYDERRFTRAGFNHIDLYYMDGGVPTDAILRRFLDACEKASGAIAVHCKAGLGRTGTCIGCYCMKHYHFTAAEFIGWTRICRPGSIIGPQQHYLKEMEQRMWKAGELYRKRQGNLASQQKPGAPTYIGMSGKNSPVNSVGSMSDDLGALSIGTGTPTRRLSSRLTNAGANLVVKTSPKDHTQGDRLRSKKSPQSASHSAHLSPNSVRYTTRSTARGMFRK